MTLRSRGSHASYVWMAPPLDRRCGPLWRSPCRLRDLRRYRRSRQLTVIRKYKCVFLTCVLPRRPPFAPSRWLAPPSSAPCRPDENTSGKFAIPYKIQKRNRSAREALVHNRKNWPHALSLPLMRGDAGPRTIRGRVL